MQFSSTPLRRINHLISELDSIYHSCALSSSLSDSEFMCLYTICVEGSECALSEIVRLSGLPKQTINSALRKMERTGIITTTGTKKKKIVSLTGEGIEKCRSSVLRLIEVENNIFSVWGDEKTEEYIRMTEDYNNRMKEGVEDLCRSN
ncbi:MAG: MarR family transcriptional regulator [Candidatus Ornithospirochaeta sp.]